MSRLRKHGGGVAALKVMQSALKARLNRAVKQRAALGPRKHATGTRFMLIANLDEEIRALKQQVKGHKAAINARGFDA